MSDKRVGFAVFVLTGSLTLAGCGGDRKSGSSTTFFQNPFRSNRVSWTILCMDFQGPDRQSRCEEVAEALKQTPGIHPRNVFILDDPPRTRLFYGHFQRPVNPKTGRFQTTPDMIRDAKLVKDLTVDGTRYFADSRLIPYPTKDVGNPAWRLVNNHGLYTLRVALFFPEPGFTAWKKAAAEFCAELRRQGFEAYYRHGDFTSEVYVGSFGEEALIRTRKSGVEFAVPSPMIRALQKNELLRYELRNMKTISVSGSDHRYVRASRVVPVKNAWDEASDAFTGYAP